MCALLFSTCLCEFHFHAKAGAVGDDNARQAICTDIMRALQALAARLKAFAWAQYSSAAALSLSTAIAATDSKPQSQNEKQHQEQQEPQPEQDLASKVQVFQMQLRGSQRRWTKISLDQVPQIIAEFDVVYLGEVHDDEEAHRCQEYLLAQLLQQQSISKANQNNSTAPRWCLAMEQFERDVQLVLDEYMAGLIPSSSFLRDARAWPNMDQYEPLLEICRRHQTPVIASNCPRRYVRLVCMCMLPFALLLTPHDRRNPSGSRIFLTVCRHELERFAVQRMAMVR